MDKPQVSGGGSFVPASINDQPPAPVIPKKNRELKRVVSPLNFSFLPSTELDRSRASPGIRSPGLTTNRSGQIVQSGTLQRQPYMNSSARNKSSDHLVQQASTPVSQSPTVPSGTLNKNSVGSGQEGTLTDRDAVSVNDVSRRAATLDRSWRTKEADFKENLPRVGGNFSFDLERDALSLLDLISEFEENGVDGIRFNSTPLSPGFESGQQTVIRRAAQQKPSSSRESCRAQQVACDVSGFNEKHVLPQKISIESQGFSKASSGNQIAHREFDEVSVRSQKVDDGLPESHNTLHKVAIGASNAYTTPDWPQELPNGTTKFDQTNILSKKFSVACGDPPGYSSPQRGEFNGSLLYPDVGHNGVPYGHRADPILKSVSTSGGHIGVSAQRGYASDSEDPMNWLEQQKAKLNMKKFYRESTKRDPMLVQELKIRQRFLGRTSVDEKESSGYSASSDGTQHSKVAAQSPDLYYREPGHEFPTSSDLNASWSDSYTHRQNISDQVVGGPSRSSVGTPDPDQNHRGGHFPKETQSPGHVSRSLSLPRYANGVTVSDNSRSLSSTACNLSLMPTTYYTNAGCAKGTNTTSPSSSFDQPEVHETCISKKIIPQHRGYSPTRLDALIEAAAVATECESSPSSSRSTEISDSGYRTASASSTNDESPLTNTAQKMSNSSAQEIPRTTNGQAGVDFEMALPGFRHQLASSNSSSKINGNLNYERFNPQSRHPTAENQFELPGITVPKQFQRLPMVDSTQFFPTDQQCPTYAKAAATSVISGNSLNPRREKTLEEEIEDLLAFGELLKQKDGHRPTDKSQLPIQDQRRQFVGVQEPFGYTSSSGVSYQNPINPTEEQKQILRITGSQDPASSMANPVTSYRQPTNVNLSNDQPVRTTTDVGLPTETRIFDQLHVETYQPNRMLVEHSYQRKESQTTNGRFDPNRDNQPDLRNQDLFVRLPFSMNSHTLPNNVTRHETVNQSRYAEQQIPANQQYAGECNRIGPFNVETGKYTATVQAKPSHPSGQSVNANTNYIESSGHEFQGRKTNGVGFNGFEYQSSVRSGNEPRISEENHHDCVILYSEDGRQVLIPKNCLDVTMTAPQSMTSPQSVSPLAAVPEHLAENVSNKVVRDVTPQDSRITQQQMGQRVATASAGGESQLMDRYGGTIAPESYTIRRQVSAGPVPQQQQFGSRRVETVRSESMMTRMPSATDSMQRRQFNSQNSDSVFRSPPPEAVSINQVAAHLRGEVSRTSSFSSSVTGQSSPSLSVDRSSGGSASSTRVVDGVDVSPQYVMQCVRDAYKEWYKPEMTRDEVVNFLKDKPPGSFIIRNSTSYVGDFALAVKVSEIPLQIQQRTGDLSEEFVRHFLIESKPSGIRLKGRSNEPLFASLTSFVFQHALTPLSLPHRLLLPTSPDTSSVGSRTGSLSRSSTSASMSKAKDEISSMLIYIGAVELETLTGPEALEKAVSQIEAQKTSPVTTTVVNCILSSQGIVLTDTKRKLFFRRHYPLSCISYCGIDSRDRRWTEEVDGSKKNTERRIFGFISRKRGSSSAGSQSSPGGNECHLFADYETGYPAERVVELINKILGENGYNVFS